MEDNQPADEGAHKVNEEMSVEFSVKELLQDLSGKIDKLSDKIDDRFSRIESRVDALENSRVQRAHLEGDVIGLRTRLETVEADFVFMKGAKRAVWAAVGLLLAIAGMLVPIVLHILS